MELSKQHAILLIDDDDELAESLREACSVEGLSFHGSKEGKGGVDCAWTRLPSAIVLSTDLPGMSGYSVCNILKRNPRLRQIPLVLTSKTAKPETFEQHKRLATRADFYLTPPIAADRIIEELRADLREPRGELVKRLMAIEAKEPSVERGAGGLFAIGVALLIALGMAAAIFFSQ